MKKWLFIIPVITPFALLYAQKAKVELVIEPTHIEVGESIRITITSTVEGNVEIDNLPSSFVQDYAISQGSHDKIDYNTGEVETFYFYSYSGVITKAGKYVIGPVYVKNLNKVYPSNKVTVTVDPKSSVSSSGTITQKQLNDPAFGILSANKTELYEGEPLILTAKVYSHYNPSHISGYNAYNVPGAVMKNPLGNPNNIKVSIERVKGENLYTFDYDKNLVFPSGVGKLTIEPYQLNLHQGYKSFPVNSGSLSVKIKALPGSAPLSFIGGVGKMSLSTSIDSTRVKQGDVFTYDVIIDGSGNLNNLKEPKLTLPKGFVIYGDPEKEEELSIGINGAEGKVKFRYHIQVLTHGSFDLQPLEISYFDPKKEKYITVTATEHKIEVVKDPAIKNIAENDVDEKTDELESANADQSNSNNSENNGTNGVAQILFITIPTLSVAGLLFLLLLKRRKRTNTVHPVTHVSAKIDHSSELEEALRRLHTLKQNNDPATLDHVQRTINLLFLHLLNIEEGIIGRSDMLNYLNENHKTEHIERLNTVFEFIDHSKYGLSESTLSLNEFGTEVELLIRGLLK